MLQACLLHCLVQRGLAVGILQGRARSRSQKLLHYSRVPHVRGTVQGG